MATAAEDKKSANQLKKEEAERRATEKKVEADRQELLDTMSDGFSAVVKGMDNVNKIMKSQTDFVKKSEELTRKLTSGIEKYMESSGKKLERTADYTEMTAKRLGTLISMQREENKDEDIAIDEKQWDVFKKMRERLVRIQMHTDNTAARLWVLQDLTKENTKAIKDNTKAVEDISFESLEKKFPLWFEIYTQKPLNRLYDLMAAGLPSGQSSGTLMLAPVQFNSIIAQLDKISENERMYALLGATGGGSLGHLHHIRALMGRLIKAARSGGFGGSRERATGEDTTRTRSPREEDNDQARRLSNVLSPWLRDLGTVWTRFTNNFMGVFQRGIIGRLASMNPLLGLFTDTLRDIGTTISDVAGSFWNTYLLLSHVFQNRAQIGSGVAKVKDKVLAKYEWLINGLSKVGTFLATNFGSLSAIGATLSGGFNFLKVGFGDITAMFGRGLLNAFTSFSSGGFRGMLGDLNKFTKGTKLGKILKPLEYIQSIFAAFTDAGEFISKGNWLGGLMAGGLRIAFTSLKMLIDVVVDIPTQLLSWVTGWLGMDKVSAFLDQDFSSMIIDAAMSGWKGMIGMFNEGFVGGITELAGFVKYVFLDMPFDMLSQALSSMGFSQWASFFENGFFGTLKNGFDVIADVFDNMFGSLDLTKLDFGSIFLNVFNSIQQWLIDSYNKVIGILPEVIRPDPISAASEFGKSPAIPADSTKNAQQSLDTTKQQTSQVIIAPQSNVITAPAAAPVPAGVIPSSNPRFNDYA